MKNFQMISTALLLSCPMLPVLAADTTIYLEKGGYAIAEVENLEYNDKWELMTEHSGYSGSGYLRYAGPSMGEGNMSAHNIDVECKFQGQPEDRLIMWVKNKHLRQLWCAV